MDSIIRCCWGSRSSCRCRRLTVLFFFGLLGFAHLLSEFGLFGVKGGGVVGCDVAQGGGALVGGGGRKGAEEGRGVEGIVREEPSCQHDG